MTAAPTACAPSLTSRLLDELDDLLGRLRERPAGGDPRDYVRLARAVSAVDALALRELAECDATRRFEEVARQSARQVVADGLGVSDDTAGSHVKLSRELAAVWAPAVDLLLNGGTTRAHVTAAVHATRHLDHAVLRASMPALLVLLKTLTPAQISEQIRARVLADDDRLRQELEAKAHARREVKLNEAAGGAWLLSGELTPEAGVRLSSVLDAVIAADRGADDDRTTPQRRHDALDLLSRHYAGCSTTDPDVPRRGAGSTRLTVLASLGDVQAAARRDLDRYLRLPGSREPLRPVPSGLSDAIDHVAGGGPWPACDPAARGFGTLLPAELPPAFAGAQHSALPDAALLRHLCTAEISLLLGEVTEGGAWEPLHLSKESREVSEQLRRAVTARDRHCVAKGCRRRPSSCQVHHVFWWTRGGKTTLGNLVLLCHLHHHDVHDRGIMLEHRDGRVLTPDGFRDPPEPVPL